MENPPNIPPEIDNTKYIMTQSLRVDGHYIIIDLDFNNSNNINNSNNNSNNNNDSEELDYTWNITNIESFQLPK